MDTVTRADIERLCWRLSGWRVDQRSVDALLAAIDTHIRGERAAQRAVEGAREAQGRPAGLPGVRGPQKPSGSPQGARGAVQPVKPKRVDTWTSQTDPEERERTCTKCRRAQLIEQYARDKRGRKGRKAVCRGCDNERKNRQARERRAAARTADGN